MLTMKEWLANTHLKDNTYQHLEGLSTNTRNAAALNPIARKDRH
jgi:hypothetical protein